MAVADTTKSVVHINDRLIKRGPYAVTLGTVAAAGSFTVTATGAQVGDVVIAFQPATAADTGGGLVVDRAYVSAANTVTFVTVGTGSLTGKNYIITTLASTF